MSDPGISVRSAQTILADLIGRTRDYAHHENLPFCSRTFRTRDGLVTVDYQRDKLVRVTFTGDAPARSYTLPADWPASDLRSRAAGLPSTLA